VAQVDAALLHISIDTAYAYLIVVVWRAHW